MRPATAADIPAIAALERATPLAAHWSNQSYGAIFEADAVPRIALVIDDQREHLNSLQGFLFARIIGTDCELENIVVASALQRQGLGKQLLEALIAAARPHKAKSLFLGVRESNLAARSLYEKCGFRVIGHRRAYYKDPSEDAVEYTLLL